MMWNQQRVRAARAVYNYQVQILKSSRCVWCLSSVFSPAYNNFLKYSLTKNFFITKPWTFSANLHQGGNEPFMYFGMFVNNLYMHSSGTSQISWLPFLVITKIISFIDKYLLGTLLSWLRNIAIIKIFPFLPSLATEVWALWACFWISLCSQHSHF